MPQSPRGTLVPCPGASLIRHCPHFLGLFLQTPHTQVSVIRKRERSQFRGHSCCLVFAAVTPAPRSWPGCWPRGRLTADPAPQVLRLCLPGRHPALSLSPPPSHQPWTHTPFSCYTVPSSGLWAACTYQVPPGHPSKTNTSNSMSPHTGHQGCPPGSPLLSPGVLGQETCCRAAFPVPAAPGLVGPPSQAMQEPVGALPG